MLDLLSQAGPSEKKPGPWARGKDSTKRKEWSWKDWQKSDTQKQAECSMLRNALMQVKQEMESESDAAPSSRLQFPRLRCRPCLPALHPPQWRVAWTWRFLATQDEDVQVTSPGRRAEGGRGFSGSMIALPFSKQRGGGLVTRQAARAADSVLQRRGLMGVGRGGGGNFGIVKNSQASPINPSTPMCAVYVGRAAEKGKTLLARPPQPYREMGRR